MELLLQTASRDNILTLTTRCATSCIFCSHHQNPPDILAYYVDDLNDDDIDMLLEFLENGRDIVIGESATRICEGEPFIHKDIINILKKLRNKFPDSKIKITTSAVPLDEEKIKILKEIGNIELNVSINSCNSEARKKLYGGRELMEAVGAICLLKRYQIRFSGSIVAMPHVVGWDDIEETVEFLSKNRAETIRIFMPGYTKYSKSQPSANVLEELYDFLDAVRRNTEVPIIVEPAMIKNLDAIVEGVIKNSPAFKAGIKAGDIIETVNDAAVFSRADAYYKLLNEKNPRLRIMRRSKMLYCQIKKARDTSSGLVFNYDMEQDTIDRIEGVLNRSRGQKCLLLTSGLAFDRIKLCIKSNNVNIQAVDNSYFGGNIMCAGLLTLRDIMEYLQALDEKPERVILPAIMFDHKGRDLLGEHYMNIYDDLGINIDIV